MNASPLRQIGSDAAVEELVCSPLEAIGTAHTNRWETLCGQRVYDRTRTCRHCLRSLMRPREEAGGKTFDTALRLSEIL